MYYHGKEFCPIFVRPEQILNVISIRGNAAFLNERIKMVHQCTRSIVVGSFLERGITSDRNNAPNWFHSNEDGAELFSMIVLKLPVSQQFGHNVVWKLVGLCYRNNRVV